MSLPNDDEPAENHRSTKQASNLRVATGWTVGLMLSAVAVVIAIWQVNEQLYTPESTAEHYWQSLSDGDGAEALGQFNQLPEHIDDDQLDHLLLDELPLAHSAQLMEAMEIGGTDTSAHVDFIVGSESYSAELPVVQSGSAWGLFNTWELAPEGLTWFELEVPGAPEGGIGQVQVNGEPVNLDDDTARLSAFVPSAAEITVDSQWLTGSFIGVVSAPDPDLEATQEVTLDLEASEDALSVLQDELSEFLDDCDQQVLMPSGCPAGVSTPHQIEADTISWSFPDPEEFNLTFDDDGWEVGYDQLVAEVSFEATHHQTGESLEETEEAPFDLDITVQPTDEELVVSVSGE